MLQLCPAQRLRLQMGMREVTAAAGRPRRHAVQSKPAEFDGAKAYDFTAKLVSFGPRPPATDAIHKTQDYIISQLKSFGCAVDEDNFNSQTPIGNVAMKNIIAKIPGTGQGIILRADALRHVASRWLCGRGGRRIFHWIDAGDCAQSLRRPEAAQLRLARVS